VKVKVYNLGKYLDKKYIDRTVTPIRCPVRFSTIAIVECKNGVVVCDYDCCGYVIKEQGLDYKVRVHLREQDMICLSYHELPYIEVSLKEIINNCEYKLLELTEYVCNPYKRRIQENMVEVEQYIRMLNKRNKKEELIRC
jgi:hypothetical protein